MLPPIPSPAIAGRVGSMLNLSVFSGDVFRDFVGFLERNRVMTVQRPMVVDELRRPFAHRTAMSRTRRRCVSSAPRTQSAPWKYITTGNRALTPRGRTTESGSNCRPTGIRSLSDVCRWHRNRTSRNGIADIPRCIWCHCENARATRMTETVWFCRKFRAERLGVCLPTTVFRRSSGVDRVQGQPF